MSIRAQALKGVQWSAIGNWARQIISFAVFTILARLLDPRAFGLVALATVFTHLMEIFARQGVGVAIIQKKDLEDLHVDTAFWMNFMISGTLTTGVILLRRPISELLGNKELSPIIGVLSVNFMITAMSIIQTSLLTKELQFKLMSIRKLVSMTVAGATAITLAFLGVGVWALVCNELFTSFLIFLLSWKICKWRPKVRFSFRHLKEILGFSLRILTNNLVFFSSQRIDQLLIGKILNSEILGHYSIAKKILYLMNTGVTVPIQHVALPVFAKYQNNKNKLSKNVNDWQFIVSFVCFPLFLLISVNSNDVVSFLFGEKWKFAAKILMALCLIAILKILNIFVFPLLTAFGRPGLITFSLVFIAIGNACAAFSGIWYGMRGIITGMAIVYMGNTILGMLFLRSIKVLHIRSFLRANVLPAFASIGMVAGVVFINTNHRMLNLIVKIPLGIVIYLMFSYVLDRQKLYYIVKELKTIKKR